MAYLVLAYPEIKEEDFQFIQSIRKEYDTDYQLIKPHFTILFDTDRIELDKLLQIVQEAADETDPINLNLRAASSIPGIVVKRWFTFLVPDMGNSQIIRLHDRLYDNPALQMELREDIPYIPHITIGQFEHPDDSRSLVNKLNQKKFNIKGLINSLEIAEYNEKSIVSVKKIVLKGSR